MATQHAMRWMLVVLGIGMSSTPDGQSAAPTDSLRLDGLDGQTIDLAAPKDGVTVLVLIWSECPISNQYLPVLNGLAETWRDQPVRIVGAFVDPSRPSEELRAHADEHKVVFPVGRVKTNGLIQAYRVEKVPTALVIDAKTRIRYRGRIDDRFVSLGRARVRTPSADLANAVSDVLAGRPVGLSETPVVGCTVPDLEQP